METSDFPQRVFFHPDTYEARYRIDGEERMGMTAWVFLTFRNVQSMELSYEIDDRPRPSVPFTVDVLPRILSAYCDYVTLVAECDAKEWV